MKKEPKQKLYCYVDETGQDTAGKLFIVAIIVLASDLEIIRKRLQEIEVQSGKHEKKWQKTRNQERLNYIQLILKETNLSRSFFFCSYQNAGREYLPLMVYSIANVLNTDENKNKETHLTIDALNKKERFFISSRLRRLNLNISKVVGKRDQSEPILRLADALAGFTRDGVEGNDKFKLILDKSFKSGKIRQIK